YLPKRRLSSWGISPIRHRYRKLLDHFSPCLSFNNPPVFLYLDLDPQLPLGILDKIKIRHIRNRHRSVDVHGLLRLVDDHFETVLRHATIFAEDAPGGFVCVDGGLTVRLSPFHHDLNGPVTILAHIAVSPDPGLDHSFHLVGFLAELFRGAADAGERESKKLIGSGQHVKTQLLRFGIRWRGNNNNIDNAFPERGEASPIRAQGDDFYFPLRIESRVA